MSRVVGRLNLGWTHGLTYQLDLLRRVGFDHIELLRKSSCFAAFGAWKE